MPIQIDDLPREVRDAEYAVRGPIVARAQALEREGREVIYCNIGNPQALGQAPLTHLRQLLALCQYPDLIDRCPEAFPGDVRDTARNLLAGIRYGLGAYSESKGLRYIREAVAAFIQERDGIAADPEAIYLTDGASKGVQSALRILIGAPGDGILVPIPQYPLYSATLTLFGGRQVDYHLDEARGWGLDRDRLEASLAGARRDGIRVRGICVINPGNPTGSVLSEADIRAVLAFAREHGLAVLADEVYQENVYRPGERFTSFARVLEATGEREVSLFSFHSCSKGYLGECGQRGGYMEVRNVGKAVAAQLTKLQSISLCANLTGQVATFALVRPPRPGEPSHARFAAERDGILAELARRAGLLAEGLGRIPGIACQPVAGAMYAFPRITLPPGRSDEDYCMALLEATGICVVPGTGFGQEPGTAHFRTTILPPTEQMERVVERLADFHRAYR